MLIPSLSDKHPLTLASLSRRVNANSQRGKVFAFGASKLIKKGEC